MKLLTCGLSVTEAQYTSCINEIKIDSNIRTKNTNCFAKMMGSIGQWGREKNSEAKF